MKKIVLGIFLLICGFLLQGSLGNVSAHSLGQPPYLKIDGKYSNLYVVPLSSLPPQEFNLPEDNAPSNYLLNQSINFQLDRSFLPLNESDLNTAQFSWDFGDGTKDTGRNLSHTYQKMGSYILTITI